MAKSNEKPKDSSTPVKDFEYGITIDKYTGAEAAVVIPAEVNGVPVTKIGDWAFSSCDSLTEIRIPDSVARIGDWAFHKCRNLTKIQIPNSVTEIGANTFSRCGNLTEMNIPESVTRIGNDAFKGSGLIEIRIPDSVTKMGNGIIDECEKLQRVYINTAKWSYADVIRIFGKNPRFEILPLK